MVQSLSRSAMSIFCLFIFLATTSVAKADILFEGYSKITSGGVHVGFVATRYDFDPKKKQFTCTYFLKTGTLGSDISESLNAVADKDLNPISYKYTSVVGKTTKTIDASFKKNQMTALVNDGGKTKTIRKDLAKGTFQSCFLVYLMLKNKNGMRTDTKYEYTAIAEEDAEVLKGEALVGKEEKYNGILALKVLNRFKDTKFISYVTDRGEVLGTSSPANGIGTELMAKPSDAVGTFAASASLMKSVFGDMPLGTENIVSKTAKNEALNPTPTKQGGVPQGQGIQIKGSASSVPSVNPPETQEPAK